MKNILTKIILGFAALSLFFSLNTTKIFAAGTAHVQVTGSTSAIFSGNITLAGCTIQDESTVSHVFTDSYAVCVLDAAAKAGSFSYGLKDFGGSLGLFIDQIGQDKGAADFSTYWSYDVNGQPAQQGISSQLVKDGDQLLFHFVDPSVNANQQAITNGIHYLTSQQNTDGSIAGFAGVSPWTAIAFSAAGSTNDSLINYISSNPPASTAPATDWGKGILAITAAGKNPFNFGGVNYEAKLESFDTGSQIGVSTQVNDDVFGLLALLASGPGASTNVKQDALHFIIAHQNTDGGFSWSTTGTSDTDDTAAALQALIAAQNNGINATGLSNAITKAKTFLLSEQKSDGGFVSTSSDTSSNTATTSWATMALYALGMGNDTQTKNALTFIKGNQQKDGSFAWQSTSTGETFTTSYAIPALEGKSWPISIYSATISITPTITATPSPTPTETITLSPTPTDIISITPTPTMVESVITESPTPTTTLTPTVIPTDQGNNHKRKAGRNFFQDIRKHFDDDFKNFGRQNRSIYLHVQEFVHECNRRIKSFFHR